MCHWSQEWAEELASRDELAHREDAPGQPSYGENVFMIYHPGRTVTAQEVVDYWYKEGERHPFLEEPTNTESGQSPLSTTST